MFRPGDQVERDIDGMWFEADIKAAHKPPPRNPDSRGQRRCYSYDLLYPDTKNTELHVPEDEIRLKVGRKRSSAGLKADSTDDNAVPSYNDRRSSPDKAVATVAPVKEGFVMVGEQVHEGVPHTSVDGVDEGKRNDPDRVDMQKSNGGDLLDPFASTAAEQDNQKKCGKVNVHQLDDNERFQSTGSAYITHGHVGAVKPASGGGGLRAIRMLRK